MSAPPRPGSVEVGGLRLAFLRWPEVPGAPDAGETILLLHGFLDLSWGMEPLARALRGAGVGAAMIAPDWRGHGDSAWLGPGASYYFLDYVADLAGLVEALGRGPAFLVGHSMGGGAASLYAGTFPDAVRGLVIVEGLGPPARTFGDAPAQTRAWIEATRRRRAERAQPRRIESLAEAARRLRRTSPELAEAEALRLAERATREGEGGRVWKFDPLHRAPSPLPFYPEQAMAFWRQVSAPVLLVEGSESPWRALPDLEARRACFARRRLRVVEGVGHMVHHEAPGALAALVADFFRAVWEGRFEPEA